MDKIPSWSKEYETGIKAIDRDHQALFEEINNLARALVENQSAKQVEQAIACLENYVREHFEREENFMIQAGYPQTEAHLRTHRAMERQVGCLRELHRKGEHRIDPAKLIRYLSDWLSQHILKTDMEYVPYLRGERDDQDEHVAERLHEVVLQVPEGKRDVVEKFIGVVMSDKPLARELASLVEEFEVKLDRQEMEDARATFCSD